MGLLALVSISSATGVDGYEGDRPMRKRLTMDMDMMMPMYFWSGYDVNELYWLFKDIKTENSGDYACGLIVVFLFGVLIEGITYLRNFLYIRSQINAIRNTEALNR